MTGERDIAGFVLPFAAGIMVATFSGIFTWTSSHGFATLSLLALSLSVTFLLHPIHRNLNDPVLICILTTAALSCGLFLGFTTNITCISSSVEGPVLTRMKEIGNLMNSHIRSIPFESESTGSIISALITGDRSHIPAEITSAFRQSGASHLLALSGMHLGIIYGLVSRILSIMGNRPSLKLIRSVISVSICGIYTASTGAGPSITRAFIFILLGETARLTGRSKDISGILFAALSIQLILWPDSISEVGFQLSYAAMAGIAFIYPRLKKFWPRETKGPMKWIWNSAALSISCQLTTGPLAYLYFGTFPKHFLVTNLLALPLTGIIIPVSLLTLALEIAGICPQFIIEITEVLVSCLWNCLTAIATM